MSFLRKEGLRLSNLHLDGRLPVTGSRRRGTPQGVFGPRQEPETPGLVSGTDTEPRST